MDSSVGPCELPYLQSCSEQVELIATARHPEPAQGVVRIWPTLMPAAPQFFPEPDW